MNTLALLLCSVLFFAPLVSGFLGTESKTEEERGDKIQGLHDPAPKEDDPRSWYDARDPARLEAKLLDQRLQRLKKDMQDDHDRNTHAQVLALMLNEDKQGMESYVQVIRSTLPLPELASAHPLANFDAFQKQPSEFSPERVRETVLSWFDE